MGIFSISFQQKCSYCAKSGGTVGCEFRKCTKTYHYSCARKARAMLIENDSNGIYKLYCQNHSGKYGFSEFRGKGNDGQGDGQSSPKRNEYQPGASNSGDAMKESNQNGNQPQPGASDGLSFKRMTTVSEDYESTSSNDSMPSILEILEHIQASHKCSDVDNSLVKSDDVCVPKDSLQPSRQTLLSPLSTVSDHVKQKWGSFDYMLFQSVNL
uniref:PHD-type domain-containing protein n=1 Tax=Eptatretus burgeri TaxID=7764 RepID=A0A8C4QDP9_EPTBU